MFFPIPEPYWITAGDIPKVEKLRSAKYLGPWCCKAKGGGWYEEPVDVFYQPNPNKELGHTNYFGLLYKGGVLYICNAASAFEEEILGKACPDGEVLVSRFRHNYESKGEVMVDGGRDYFRCSLAGVTVRVIMKDGEFSFEPS